jgi:hypothetical protein
MKENEVNAKIQMCEYILNALCIKELTGDGRTHISRILSQLYRQKNELSNIKIKS